MPRKATLVPRPAGLAPSPALHARYPLLTLLLESSRQERLALCQRSTLLRRHGLLSGCRSRDAGALRGCWGGWVAARAREQVAWHAATRTLPP